MSNKYSVACITLVRDKYKIKTDASCSSLDGVTACVVYTADSIRKFDSKIRFEIESGGRFDSRFDSNAKKRFADPYFSCTDGSVSVCMLMDTKHR